MDPVDLARMQLLLRYGIDAKSQIYPYPWSDPTDAPLLALVRTNRETFSLLRSRVPTEFRLAAGENESVDGVLGDPSSREFAGFRRVRWMQYWFPPTAGVDPSVAVRHGAHHVVLDEGRPVAWAWTVLAHGAAEEGWVETVPAFRRRGLGRAALEAWVRSVHQQGRVAFARAAADEPDVSPFLRASGALVYADVVEYFGLSEPGPPEPRRREAGQVRPSTRSPPVSARGDLPA